MQMFVASGAICFVKEGVRCVLIPVPGGAALGALAAGTAATMKELPGSICEIRSVL